VQPVAITDRVAQASAAHAEEDDAEMCDLDSELSEECSMQDVDAPRSKATVPQRRSRRATRAKRMTLEESDNDVEPGSGALPAAEPAGSDDDEGVPTWPQRLRRPRPRSRSRMLSGGDSLSAARGTASCSHTPPGSSKAQPSATRSGGSLKRSFATVDQRTDRALISKRLRTHLAAAAESAGLQVSELRQAASAQSVDEDDAVEDVACIVRSLPMHAAVSLDLRSCPVGTTGCTHACSCTHTRSFVTCSRDR
jgi:hypothetical protein